MKCLLWSALLLVHTAPAATIVVPASKDNTLYEDSQGTFSNGVGPYLYAGATGPFGGLALRRAVIAFDIAGAIPAGATINSVSLSLYIYNPASVMAVDMELHALLASWGEGTSNSGSEGGAGTASTVGDATWIHRAFDSARWSVPGGDFTSERSALTRVSVPGRYSFSDPQMLADVQSWYESPGDNYGWIVLGNEVSSATARRIGSRENPVLSERPALMISYTVVPEPGAGVLLVSGFIFLLARRFRCSLGA